MSWFSQFAPGLAAIACWAGALMTIWLVYFQVRHPRALAAAAAFLCWTIFFGLIFVTAGPAPILRRVEIAGALRGAELLGALCWLVWVGLMARASVTVVAQTEGSV